MNQRYKQINALNNLFTGKRGTDIVTPDELHRIQFAADVATNELNAIDDITIRDARKIAKQLIAVLETIPADD